MKFNYKKCDLYDYYFVVIKSGLVLFFVVIIELFIFVGIFGYFGIISLKLKVFIIKVFICVCINYFNGFIYVRGNLWWFLFYKYNE